MKKKNNGIKCNIDKEKEAKPMQTAVLLQKKDNEMLSEMDSYILKLQRQPKETAKTEAVKALKRTGVLSSKGAVKKKIVSWE